MCLNVDFEITFTGLLEHPNRVCLYNFKDFLYVRTSDGSLLCGFVCGVISAGELNYLCLDYYDVISYLPINEIVSITSRCEVCLHNNNECDDVCPNCLDDYKYFIANPNHDVIKEFAAKFEKS